MDKKAFGHKLRLLRVDRKMNQGELGKAIKVAQKTVSRYETGLMLPSLNKLEIIAKALKAPMSYFFE